MFNETKPFDLNTYKQILELCKQTGTTEVPMKIDVLLELGDAIAQLEADLEKQLNEAKHKAWLRGVADMARAGASTPPVAPKSPYEEGSDD